MRVRKFISNHRQLKLAVEVQCDDCKPKQRRLLTRFFLRRKRLQNALLEQLDDDPVWKERLVKFGDGRLIDFFIEYWDELLPMIIAIITALI